MTQPTSPQQIIRAADTLRLFLVGFMGSGKSYTARRLAQLLGFPYMDMDDWIAAVENRSIPTIFRDSGETYFRELELRQLRELDQLPFIIVATGGGTPCYHDNMDWMNDNGITIFISTSPTLLARRLQDTAAERPLLQSVTDLPRFIEEKLAQRLPYYQKAQIVVQQESDDDDAAQRIFDNLAQLLGH